MTARREDVLAAARQWVDFADEDLRLARHALTMPKQCPHRLVAYHAQQCVEKSLKAYLVCRSVEFPFTHNISLLLELCEDRAEWAHDLTSAEELSPYAVSLRYPGPESTVTAEDAERAIEIAAEVRGAVGRALRDEGCL